MYVVEIKMSEDGYGPSKEARSREVGNEECNHNSITTVQDAQNFTG